MNKHNNRIHVVDDDRVVCHSLCQILNKHGFDVESFQSAEEYLENLTEGFNGYLLIDHKMRGMTGLELQEKLLKENVHPTVIFITAMSEQIKERALENGALDVFEKPFDLNKLISLLNGNQH